MAGNETSLRQRREFFVTAACTALFLLLLTLGLTIGPATERSGLARSPAYEATGGNDSLVSKSLLSDTDKAAYRRIFSAQKTTDWKHADADIAKLQNNILLGDVLAERYLHRHYDTTASEIIYWLKNYSGNTQTSEMIELATHKYPGVFNKLPRIGSKRLQGYGDGNANEIRFSDNQSAKRLWQMGLDSWRFGKKPDAARYFASLASQKDSLSSWQYSASNYWAARAFDAIGEKNKANDYLEKAATNSHVFYGILARKQLDKPLELDVQPIETTEVNLEKLLDKDKIQRIIALSQAGLIDRAEAQMRQIFPTASKSEKWGLLYIASELNLSSVQISMAKQLESNDRRLDVLKYPIPEWRPEGGFRVDPALIYALMRQESGFHSAAISSAGASGLMQLMPGTAKIMRRTGPINTLLEGNINEPVLNITLGERYVEHLLKNDLVEGNLFYMLAAYNAGIGRLKEWQDSLHYNDDPLLFVETIPFAETRSYVVQVMTNYWIYSELAGATNPSIFSLSHNGWPKYAASH